MYRETFGTKGQVQLDTPEDYYEFLGFLSKDGRTTKIVWEPNDESGAWAEEGRIHFYVEHPPALNARLMHTAGNSNIVSRVNCNEFVEHINQYHGFVNGVEQDPTTIRATIPNRYRGDFDRGLGL